MELSPDILAVDTGQSTEWTQRVWGGTLVHTCHDIVNKAILAVCLVDLFTSVCIHVSKRCHLLRPSRAVSQTRLDWHLAQSCRVSLCVLAQATAFQC